MGPRRARLAGLEPLKDDNILERSTRRVILRKIRTHEIRTYYAVFPGSAAPTMVVSTGQKRCRLRSFAGTVPSIQDT